MKQIFRKAGLNRGPGLRMIKTGIAVTLCVALCSLIKLDKPFLAVIATVLSMGKSIDFSVRAGKNKMFGVLIGSAIGGAAAGILPANAGLCGIGIILVLYLCQLLRLTGAGPLACFSFIAVMFYAVRPMPWVYALVCAENALIGIAISVVVNLLIFPPNYAEEVERAYAALHEKTDFAIVDAEAMRTVDTEELESIVKRLSGDVHLYVSEVKLLRGDDDEVFSISCRVSAYRMMLDELKAINTLELEGREDIPDSLRTVYDFHIQRLHALKQHAAEEAAHSREKADPVSK